MASSVEVPYCTCPDDYPMILGHHEDCPTQRYEEAMPSFDELKQAGQTAASNLVKKEEGWIRANRKPLLISALAVIAILVIWHFL